MSLNDEDDGLAAFVVFGGEEFGGLGDQGGPVELGDAAQRGDEVVVDAAGADHRVGQVDDGMAGVVKRGAGGAGGDGLAGTDFAGEHADGLLVNQPAEPGDGLFVTVACEELPGGEVAAEGVAGEAVVGAELLDHAAPSTSSAPSASASPGRSAKLMRCRVACSCSAATRAR